MGNRKIPIICVLLVSEANLRHRHSRNWPSEQISLLPIANAFVSWTRSGLLTADYRGERTASAMENQLTALERKIDDLLASVDEQDTQSEPNRDASTDRRPK